MRKRIGYAKLGRSMPLTLAKCGNLGGDVEMVPTLKLLAERHPDVDFVLIGRNSGEKPTDVGLPSNVINPWIAWKPQVRTALKFHNLVYANLRIEDHIRVREILMNMTQFTIQTLDGIVMWLGQHGTTNTPLPMISDRTKLTKPYDWATLYGSYLLQGINAWRDHNPHEREEVLLNADPRNYVKYRDGKWPWKHPVLGQFNRTNAVKHEQGDHVVSSTLNTIYSRLEVNGLIPGTPFGDLVSYRDDNFNDRQSFGLFINEARKQVNPRLTRAAALQEWVLPLQPAFIHGTWSKESQAELGVDISPAPWTDYYPKLHSVKCTFTTPSSGSGWATTKPWEAFAAGTVCFFHPDYDTQDNIMGDLPDDTLRRWLRVSTPEELRERVKYTSESKQVWLWAVTNLRRHFEEAIAEKRWLTMIEKRLGL